MRDGDEHPPYRFSLSVLSLRLCEKSLRQSQQKNRPAIAGRPVAPLIKLIANG